MPDDDTATKSERIELRTTLYEKKLLVAAAVHEHLDVTAFVLRTAIPAAKHVVEHANKIHLSARDTERVLDLLEHPPEPSPRLRKAAEQLWANDAALTRARSKDEVRSSRSSARKSKRSR
jgi:uncharacterized protein (DUF1778 family)